LPEVLLTEPWKLATRGRPFVAMELQIAPGWGTKQIENATVN